MKRFDVVVFDLDSTLVTFEGLDWLAEHKGKGEEVAKLTSLSMEGKIKVSEAFKKKLALIAPSYQDLVKLGRKYCESIVDGAIETIALLHQTGKEVWIVTGNFRPAVKIIATKLNIPDSRVISNIVNFDNKGTYKCFDVKNPLSKNGGKAKVVKQYIPQDKKIVFIGDAVTDLETKEVVDLFIGFGGVVKRELVKKTADVYFEDKNFLNLLPLILSKEESKKARHL